MWYDLTMSEVWDILSKNIPKDLKGVFSKPDFPTKRWGKITTKTCTQEKKSLINCQNIIQEKSRIIKDKETSERLKGTFYKLQVFRLTTNTKYYDTVTN